MILALAFALHADAAAASVADLQAALASPAGWAPVTTTTERGVGPITVRHKPAAGVDCLEGAVDTQASLDRLLATARDIDGSARWSSFKLPYSKALTRASAFDYLQVLDNPSPVDDRYWLLRGTATQSANAARFTWVDIPEDAQPAAIAEVRARFPSAVPSGRNVGGWIFERTASGTRVRYQICSEAGGNIPAWVGKLAAQKALPTTMADLILQASQ
jgi:hypothetical protein